MFSSALLLDKPFIGGVRSRKFMDQLSVELEMSSSVRTALYLDDESFVMGEI